MWLTESINFFVSFSLMGSAYAQIQMLRDRLMSFQDPMGYRALDKVKVARRVALRFELFCPVTLSGAEWQQTISGPLH